MAIGDIATPTGLDEPEAPPSEPAPPARPELRPWAQIVRELLIVGIFCAGYELLRTDMVQDGAAAAAHSLAVVHLESAVGLFQEASVQRFFLRAPDLMKFFNLYYGGTHFLVPIAALVWLAVRHRDRYARARTTLGLTTGIAFVVFWLFPVAPPRMLPPRFGIIDTLVTFQQSGHLEHSLIDSAGDVYAAMPSLHVAWALWCTLVLYPVVRNRAGRVLLIAYPVVTTLVVVTTGNHFLLDAVTGALLVTAVWLAVPRVSDWTGRLRHRDPPARARSGTGAPVADEEDRALPVGAGVSLLAAGGPLSPMVGPRRPASRGRGLPDREGAPPPGDPTASPAP
jgi:hypothetical protein